MTGLYLLGILAGIMFALLSKKTVFKGEAVPFVMELPNYRLPSPRSVCQLLWEKSKDFIQKAFSIIFLRSMNKPFAKSLLSPRKMFSATEMPGTVPFS